MGDGGLDVTVAICTWNRAEPLGRTLESLCALQWPAGCAWELIVVNNNCTDNTDAVVNAYAGRLPLRLLHEAKAGKSIACNLAIRESRGRVLLWTDDDVLVDPTWAVRLLDCRERHDAEFVFGVSVPLWPGRAPAWYDQKRFGGYFAALDLGPDERVILDRHTGFYGLNYGGLKRAFEALGGFRTEFGFKGDKGGVGEDTDLYERAFDAAMKVVYTPHARVQHIIPEFRIDKAYHRRRHWVANEVYFKYLPELFPDVPWLLGLPRFLYARVPKDLLGFAKATALGRSADRFEHEMQLVRFARLFVESARSGFRSGARTA